MGDPLHAATPGAAFAVLGLCCDGRSGTPTILGHQGINVPADTTVLKISPYIKLSIPLSQYPLHTGPPPLIMSASLRDHTSTDTTSSVGSAQETSRQTLSRSDANPAPTSVALTNATRLKLMELLEEKQRELASYRKRTVEEMERILGEPSSASEENHQAQLVYQQSRIPGRTALEMELKTVNDELNRGQGIDARDNAERTAGTHGANSADGSTPTDDPARIILLPISIIPMMSSYGAPSGNDSQSPCDCPGCRALRGD